MIPITSENISEIFSVAVVDNINDIKRPVKLYCKNPKEILIDTGVDYNEIRKYFEHQEVFMTVRSYYGRIDVLVDTHKDFRSFVVFETKWTLNDLIEECDKLNAPYITRLEGEDGFYIDSTKMPTIDQRDFYASVYDTEPIRKGFRKFVDKAGEKSLISTITGLLPDELAPYKNADYTWIVWLAAEDDSTESIMITDEKCRRTILVKLR